MVIQSIDEAHKRIVEIGDFSTKLCDVLQFLVKDHMDLKNTVKKDNEALKADFETKTKAAQDQLEADTNRLKEILKRENEERQRELHDLEAYIKKENAERKNETEKINGVLNAENDKRMKEAQALKDKMEKEKKELQAYLEKVGWTKCENLRNFLLLLRFFVKSIACTF